ncbi:MAG: hypothetical protein N2588_10675 [Rhodovarius sp.]|nr:hypothetical protein [Rhodovarius sp.]
MAPWRQDALALAALLRACVSEGLERRVLHLALSALPQALRRQHHLRLLREVLQPALRPARARLFELPTGDLLLIAPPPASYLEEVLADCRRLLPESAAEAPLCREWRLPQQAAGLLALLADALGLGLPAPAPAVADPGAPLPPPTAEQLQAILPTLSRADLEVHLRLRSLCLIAPDGQGSCLLRQHHELDLPAIAAALLPGADPAAAPWLARRLRREAEQRLLALWMGAEEMRNFTPRSATLLPATILSEAFQRLDRKLAPAWRAAVTIGFAFEDALADPEAFGLARRFLALRGYRLMLAELTPEQLPLLPPDRFGLPGLEIRFTPDWLAITAAQRQALAGLLPADRDLVSLAGADAAAAIGWGWERGIHRFRGRLVETGLSAASAPR